jgi:hypothetical protein
MLLLCTDVSETVLLVCLDVSETAVRSDVSEDICTVEPDVSETVLLCSDVSETICALKLRRFGDCFIVLRLGNCAVMLRRFGAPCAVIPRRFRDYLCCYAPTCRRLSVLIRSDVSETVLLCSDVSEDQSCRKIISVC